MGLIDARQSEYYDAIAKSSKNAKSTVFIEFMLNAILEEIAGVLVSPPPKSKSCFRCLTAR